MENSSNLRVLIITGMSGAGKSQVVACLEDLGYYCIDNLPPTLFLKFVEGAIRSNGTISRVALVVDIRGGEALDLISGVLAELKDDGIEYEVLFLEAQDDVLVRRYKETRRRHPLALDGGSILDMIRDERHRLTAIRDMANIILDTSELTTKKLHNKIISLFGEAADGKFPLTVMSFGYKYGLPIDADLAVDVRFLPNPYYIEKLKPLTGLNQEVSDYVLSSEITKEFIEKYVALLNFLIPYYIDEGKKNLCIAIGCTGGQHRSVAIAEEIAARLKKDCYKIKVIHRDVSKAKYAYPAL